MGYYLNMTTLSAQSPDKVFQIANYFIKKAQEDKKELSNKKLQKLLYYSQAWNYTLSDQKLFDEKIEAWVHGPAIRAVYRKFSEFGWQDLASRITVSENDVSGISSDEQELLDKIWEVYGKYDANYLEMLTHSEDPWQEARKGLEPYQASDKAITLTSMKRYYGQKRQEAKS